MTPSVIPRQRNLTLEICKLVASAFVVFIHVPFPWPAGDFVLCLSRFAVPLFFAISGWYSYQTRPKKLLQRMGRILLLELAGVVLILLWGIFAAVYTGQNLSDILRLSPPLGKDWTYWLTWLEDPLESHLWYLSASAFTYAVFALYTWLRGENDPNGPLYLLGFLLLAAHFAMDELSGLLGIQVFFKVPRTGLFQGLPMFLMGLFLREHRDALLRRLGDVRLILLMVLGVALSIGEWKLFGSHSLYLGLLPAISALLLLTCRHPTVPRPAEKAAAACGPVSTVIYLVHLTLLDIYLAFGQAKVEQLLGSSEPWIRPLVILAAAFAVAVGWQILTQSRKRSQTS